MIDIESSVRRIDRFITDTADARLLSEKCRDYHDHKQWTEEEAAKLFARRQATIVVNRVRPKVKGLVGLYELRKSDPKAYPRTRKHDKAAHAASDALRFVADNTNFDTTRLDVAEEFFVEGYSGAIVEVRNKGQKINIEINRIPWDRIYYDPHSRKKDFSDARWLGFYLWMYIDELQESFPDVDAQDLISAGEYTDETTEDRPRWFSENSDRIRIAVDFVIDKGVWHMSIFTHSTYLMNPQPSPYLDEDGAPECPIELVAANIDRNNNRYGEVAGFLDQQDELNHRRSKALHYLNQRQTWGRKGGVADVAALKRELAKPDGHYEGEGEFGKDWGIFPTNDRLQGQFELYQDAKAELDSVSFNAQLAGERQQGDLSGRAIDKLQAAGTIELNQDYSTLAGWELRIYRQVWARIKQFWTEEKWIRVTDDHENLRWVGLNGEITVREQLEEWINDESLSIADRRKYAAVYQELIATEAMSDQQIAAAVESGQLSQEQVPVILAQRDQASAQLDQIVPTKANDVAELDVDLILDQSFDTINVQQEQFNMLVQFAQGQDIDVIELIELSSLRGKDELIDKIQSRRQAAIEAQGNTANIQQQKEQAELFKTTAEADGAQAKANQTKIENELLLTNPDKVTSVAV